MQEMLNLSQNFWTNKYETNKIGWDLGEVSPPLKNYFDQLQNKELKILIPGGGNSYEAEYLFNKGFHNVYVVDIAKQPLNNIKLRVPDFPDSQLIHANFFDVDNQFDLIIEQTFFCAINPKLRAAYAAKAFELLNTNGKVVGLLFNEPLNTDKPPFGGCKEEYINHFKPYFNITIIEESYNSIQPRVGRELFFRLDKC
ncbi:methyltransferase domain-containing protein [Polaribacter sp.]|uniref:methyltransferase domain-containing protein n=1 Tax=Polaribacter sp. TaxID=1920175 RepID=UPI00261D45A4|nr:methyltransferase domain-containing protein [uncultured Polaribacter sp.]